MTAYKRPESVLVLVHTLDGQVLRLRRVRPAGFWQSVTGSLEWDEHPLQAARRELAEETGFAVDDETGQLIDCHTVNRFPILPAWRARYAPGVEVNTEHVFRFVLSNAQPVRLSPLEHTEYRWVDKAQALRLADSYTDRAAIEAWVP